MNCVFNARQPSLKEKSWQIAGWQSSQISSQMRKVRRMIEVHKQWVHILWARCLCAVHHGKPQLQAQMTPILWNAHSERLGVGGETGAKYGNSRFTPPLSQRQASNYWKWKFTHCWTVISSLAFSLFLAVDMRLQFNSCKCWVAIVYVTCIGYSLK